MNRLAFWGYKTKAITFKGHLPKITIFVSEWLIIMPLLPVIVRQIVFETSSSSEQSDQIIHEEEISLLLSTAVIQEHSHH